MSVLIDNRQEIVSVDEKLESFVESVINGVIKYQESTEEYEVSISFVDNDAIRDLNNEYRGIDFPTDVLSFPMLEFIEDDEVEALDQEDFIDEELPLGDIVISMEKVIDQASEYGHSFERELAFLLIHGMLHLFGHDHENEKDEKIMFEKQENVLKMLNINR